MLFSVIGCGCAVCLYLDLILCITVCDFQFAILGCDDVILALRSFRKLIARDRIVAFTHYGLASVYRYACKSVFSDEASLSDVISAVCQCGSVIRLLIALCRDLNLHRIDCYSCFPRKCSSSATNRNIFFHIYGIFTYIYKFWFCCTPIFLICRI